MKLKYFFTWLPLLALVSCNKELNNIDAPDFNVTTESRSFKAGEPVTFHFSGDADMISFYSGLPSNNYDFREGRMFNVADSGAILSFSSSVQEGSQANQLSVLVSTDFSGNYDNLASVKAATWSDITHLFRLGTNATFQTTGNIEISEMFEPGKPLYLAFRYVTKPQADNGLARNWWIQNFLITSKGSMFANKAINLADQASAGFRIVDNLKQEAPARSIVTNSRLSLWGNVFKDPDDPLYDPANPIYDPLNPIYNPQSNAYQPGAVRPTFIPYDPASPYNDPQAEHWAVSRPITKDQVDLGPDWAISVKGLADMVQPTFQYIYNVPGTYKVYFVASNNTIDAGEQVIRSLDITITQ